jgi:hypothetical protein
MLEATKRHQARFGATARSDLANERREHWTGKRFEPSGKLWFREGSNSEGKHEEIRPGAVPTFALITINPSFGDPETVNGSHHACSGRSIATTFAGLDIFHRI